jgi:hypothetical protein
MNRGQPGALRLLCLRRYPGVPGPGVVSHGAAFVQRLR